MAHDTKDALAYLLSLLAKSPNADIADIPDVVAIDYLRAGIDIRRLFLEFNVDEYLRESLRSSVGRFYLLPMSSEFCINYSM